MLSQHVVLQSNYRYNAHTLLFALWSPIWVCSDWTIWCNTNSCCFAKVWWIEMGSESNDENEPAKWGCSARICSRSQVCGKFMCCSMFRERFNGMESVIQFVLYSESKDIPKSKAFFIRCFLRCNTNRFSPFTLKLLNRYNIRSVSSFESFKSGGHWITSLEWTQSEWWSGHNITGWYSLEMICCEWEVLSFGCLKEGHEDLRKRSDTLRGGLVRMQIRT